MSEQPTPREQALEQARTMIQAGLDLAHDLELLAPKPPLRVWVLTIDHKHGTDITVYATHDNALAALTDYCLDWWQDGAHGAPPTPPEDTATHAQWIAYDQAVIAQYFASEEEGFGDAETYGISEQEVL